MQLVLLPGMDGTGKLFADFASCLRDYSFQSIQVVPLLDHGPQDYLSLTIAIKTKLPKSDFVIIAESFSGPIAYLLAQEKIDHLKAVFFVASFLSPPRPQLASILNILPIRLLFKEPLFSFALKHFMVNGNTKPKVLALIKATILSVPIELLRLRLELVNRFDAKLATLDIQAVYIGAEEDWLVPKTKVREFEQVFKNLVVETVEGPHFLLQTQPRRCAEIIKRYLD